MVRNPLSTSHDSCEISGYSTYFYLLKLKSHAIIMAFHAEHISTIHSVTFSGLNVQHLAICVAVALKSEYDLN